jgi:hypothetical protein
VKFGVMDTQTFAVDFLCMKTYCRKARREHELKVLENKLYGNTCSQERWTKWVIEKIIYLETV